MESFLRTRLQQQQQPQQQQQQQQQEEEDNPGLRLLAGVALARPMPAPAATAPSPSSPSRLGGFRDAAGFAVPATAAPTPLIPSHLDTQMRSSRGLAALNAARAEGAARERFSFAVRPEQYPTEQPQEQATQAETAQPAQHIMQPTAHHAQPGQHTQTQQPSALHTQPGQHTEQPQAQQAHHTQTQTQPGQHTQLPQPQPTQAPPQVFTPRAARFPHPDYFQHPAFPRFPDFLYTDHDARDRQISGYIHYVAACGFPTAEIHAALCIQGLSLGDLGLTRWREILQREDVSEEMKEEVREMLRAFGARVVA